jgi:hypothetical protein
MATYLPLAPIQVTATPDQSGLNPGNYTCAFTSAVLRGLNVPYFELYHATVQNVPAGASAVIGFSLAMPWGFTAPGLGAGAEYHLGAAGWILTPSQEFYFFWTGGTSGTAPLVTAWFRYDQDIGANALNAGRK